LRWVESIRKSLFVLSTKKILEGIFFVFKLLTVLEFCFLLHRHRNHFICVVPFEPKKSQDSSPKKNIHFYFLAPTTLTWRIHGWKQAFAILVFLCGVISDVLIGWRIPECAQVGIRTYCLHLMIGYYISKPPEPRHFSHRFGRCCALYEQNTLLRNFARENTTANTCLQRILRLMVCVAHIRVIQGSLDASGKSALALMVTALFVTLIGTPIFLAVSQCGCALCKP
jgi:hypothetical protein